MPATGQENLSRKMTDPFLTGESLSNVHPSLFQKGEPATISHITKATPFYHGTDTLFTCQRIADPVSLLEEYTHRHDALHGTWTALFLQENGSHPTSSWLESRFFTLLDRQSRAHSAQAGARLQDASSTTLNTTPQGNHSSTTTSKRGRKRKAANAPDGRASKRTKGPTAQASSPSTSAFAPPDPPLAASHCGVGPLASPGPCDATSILDSSASGSSTPFHLGQPQSLWPT